MIGNIFFWLTKRRQMQKLVVRAEALARGLNALPADPASAKENPLVGLQSICALLERLVDQQKETSPVEKQRETSPSAISEPVAPTPLPAQSLSITAKELMKLSDWVLLAKTNTTTVQPAVLEEIYRQLTVVLAKEGVTPLLATGPCDYDRQQVMGTHPTNDPSQNDCVHSTIRPGYLFHEQLIRPQEVIIYTT
jgi:hypothetical protein